MLLFWNNEKNLIFNLTFIFSNTPKEKKCLPLVDVNSRRIRHLKTTHFWGQHMTWAARAPSYCMHQSIQRANVKLTQPEEHQIQAVECLVRLHTVQVELGGWGCDVINQPFHIHQLTVHRLVCSIDIVLGLWLCRASAHWAAHTQREKTTTQSFRTFFSLSLSLSGPLSVCPSLSDIHCHCSLIPVVFFSLRGNRISRVPFTGLRLVFILVGNIFSEKTWLLDLPVINRRKAYVYCACFFLNCFVFWKFYNLNSIRVM